MSRYRREGEGERREGQGERRGEKERVRGERLTLLLRLWMVASKFALSALSCSHSLRYNMVRYGKRINSH